MYAQMHGGWPQGFPSWNSINQIRRGRSHSSLSPPPPCVCVCTCLCGCAHACVHACMYMFVWVCTSMCACLYAHVCVDVHMYVCIHVWICPCMYTCMWPKVAVNSFFTYSPLCFLNNTVILWECPTMYLSESLPFPHLLLGPHASVYLLSF